REGSDRLADRIADCIDLILPLYFSQQALCKARRQLQDQRAVLIEGTVATAMGAEVAMSHADGKISSFLPHEQRIPRGKSLVPLEAPAIGGHSSEAQVLAILEDLAKGAAVVSVDKAGTASRRKNDAARIEELRRD